MHRMIAVALAATLSWAWPVDGGHVVVRPYVAPATTYGAGHRGVDLASGDTLYAPADGVVHFAGTVVDRGVLSLDVGGGVLVSFEPVTPTVSAGEEVHRGEAIATVEPGHCAAVCVHVGARLGGEYVSPLLYLGGLRRAVLLPTRELAGR